MGTDYHVRPDCRLCASPLKRSVLQLEPTPLANEFLQPGDVREELFPLYLVECMACGHVQLPVVVDPERLFRNYVYVSGTSPTFVEHFRRYADEVSQAHNLQEGDLVVEIGSNDGTLLRWFQQKGLRVLGVDPAAQIAGRATEQGIETLPFFFRETLAEHIVGKYGQAQLVVANNVFAHADDLAAIVRGVKKILAPRHEAGGPPNWGGGVFIFEVQYLRDMLDGGLFDMVYHEHLSYHDVGPLSQFLRRHGLILKDVERVSTHGGSIRCTAEHIYEDRTDQDPVYGRRFPSVLHACLEEQKRPVASLFSSMQQQIADRGFLLRTYLHSARMKGKTVGGYGAPAKATTLMRQFKIAGLIDNVMDDSPWKQGLCMPGSSIPVVSPYQTNPDVLVLFAWNFAEPILAKLRAAGFFDGHRVAVVPLPDFKEIRS